MIRPFPKPVPKMPRPKPPNPLRLPRKRYMTLVAGWKCRDGLVMAADTEISHGLICFQGHKLAQFHGDYDLIIGGAGDGSYIDMTAQKIRDSVNALSSPTFADIKSVTESTIYQMYSDHIFKFWRPDDSDCPEMSLVVGVKDSRSEFGLLASEGTTVSEIGECIFSGSGSQVAEHLSERLFRPRLPVAAVAHIAQQFFRDIKGKAVGVGGNTEIISLRRDVDFSEPFFPITQEHDRDRFLWGLMRF
jgi:20S proteasome alpha/beta subunit